MSGPNDRRAVAVRIAGQDYKIRGDGDEEGLVRIAGYVDQAMLRVRERTGTVDSLDVAVLTCLNLARELLALHEQRSGGAGEERVRELIERVEAAIGRPPQSESPELSGVISACDASSAEARPRMIELPAVEGIRERLQAGFEAGSGAAAEVAQQVRVAAGGRDRIG